MFVLLVYVWSLQCRKVTGGGSDGVLGLNGKGRSPKGLDPPHNYHCLLGYNWKMAPLKREHS